MRHDESITALRRGFTLIELLAAIVSAGVVAVLAGVMVVYTFTALRRNTEVVDMQRDASVAMEMIVRAVRASTATNTAVPSAGRLDVGSASFYANGNDLMYDPDTGLGGDEITIISGRLQLFTPSVSVEAVDVQMTIESKDGAETTTMDTTTKYRNT